MTLKLRRIEPGLYRSKDGRVEIARVRSQQTRREDAMYWRVVVDGVDQIVCQDTKRDAVYEAERALRRST